MFNSSESPWSDNPNAPKIPHWVYFGEKASLVGSFVGAIFYGIVIVLFFQCMCALLDPVNRVKGGIKWALVTHTTVMFSLATIYVALILNTQSISFIDNRDFPGSSTDSAIPPGPYGYQWFIHYKAIGIAPGPILALNAWLADCIILYRYYIVHSKNHWVMIFPCMMYLACIATGILSIYQTSRPGSSAVTSHVIAQFTALFMSLSLSLNIHLTFVIAIRLILHRKNIRKAMGIISGAGGLYKLVATITIESFALSLVGYLLYFGWWAGRSPLQDTFMHLLAQIQVIAPFLVILRVANGRALTGDNIAFGKSTSDCRTLFGARPRNSVGADELGVGSGTTIGLHRHSGVSEFEESPKV